MAGSVVGRELERAAAERFLTAMPAGRAGLLLEGEPGIGKTAVWSEIVERGGELGYRVLVTRCTQAEAKLSFSGLADLLREVDDLQSLPGPQRSALEVALLRSDGTGAGRHAVFAGVVTLLSSLAEERPVLVAVDDVQW